MPCRGALRLNLLTNPDSSCPLAFQVESHVAHVIPRCQLETIFEALYILHLSQHLCCSWPRDSCPPSTRFMAGSADAEAKAAFLRGSPWLPADQAAAASLPATASAAHNSCTEASEIAPATPLLQKLVPPTTLAHHQERHTSAETAVADSSANDICVPLWSYQTAAESGSQQLRSPSCIPPPALDTLPRSTDHLPQLIGKGANQPPLVVKQGFKPPWNSNPTSAAYPTISCSGHTTIERPQHSIGNCIQGNKVSFPDTGAYSFSEDHVITMSYMPDNWFRTNVWFVSSRPDSMLVAGLCPVLRAHGMHSMCFQEVLSCSMSCHAPGYVPSRKEAVPDRFKSLRQYKEVWSAVLNEEATLM